MKKKILIGLLTFILITGCVIAYLFFSNDEALPSGQTGDQAEAIALKMSKAIHKTAWDTTAYIQWSFRGEHHYLWDRQRKVVEVKWGESRVLLNIDDQSGRTYMANAEITDAQKKNALLAEAHSFFINDAFWLNAPSMIYNPDVTRSYVPLEDGRDGLLVTYNSGGVTPGDSYLWKLDPDGLPTSYQMWVSIIPVGGLEFTWENWTTLKSGAKIAQHHASKILEIPITNILDSQNYADFNHSSDPFAEISPQEEVKKK